MNRRNVYLFIFIIIALGSGWIGVLLDSILKEQSEGNSLGMGLWLVLPFLTVIVIRLISRDWKDMGIRFNFKGNIKWYALSVVIYPFVTVLTVGLALVIGEASLSSVDVDAMFSLVAVSVAGNFIKNIFEEFSWRGYLTPKLIEIRVNDWLIYFISGLVWALWHAPYYIVFLPDVNFETISRLDMLLLGCVLMVCWTIMYVELYRLTKSVWPAVLMHAVEDGFPTVLVIISGFVTFTNKGNFWLNPISGAVATILFTAIGLYLRTIRIKKERLINGMIVDKDLGFG
ncbi:CPBP family intramembrane metalloprotease [Oceanobacillus arenosus]|uniref:CPBP family intramembrane metalloprotease n=1 Tax=Oceanobacillus arenosus TaxID=1229153 RepID=A0A3D8PP89_9BACI|nr:CPBP family glutamic-type intramembrane protease [Oceanobacillus arenosus]RDW17472.1 CPBP family intramembrane metalloprotease [Oceanobacillus arenosus]